MGAAEKTEILDAIENDISNITTDTSVVTESTGADVKNTRVHVEITVVVSRPQECKTHHTNTRTKK